MFKKGIFILIYAFLFSMLHLQAQTENVELKNVNKTLEASTASTPVISYSKSKKYEIADIVVTGVTNPMYDDYTLIGFSEISVGDVIEIPGHEITNAVKRFWRQGLFSDVQILATKVENNKIWLEFKLTERPRISSIAYSGMKKSEQKDIEAKIGIYKDAQISQHQLDRAEVVIRSYFDEKGFNKAEINLVEKPDLSNENQVILHVNVVKKNKTKVNNVIIEGNSGVQSHVLEASMKKTRHKTGLRAFVRNFLRSTKYVPESYEEDKQNLINKYNELGYRDATIVWDSVYAAIDEGKANKMNIKIKVDEGDLYHLRNVTWIGNTQAHSADLQRYLLMKKGDVYNQKKLMQRLQEDEDGVLNVFYQNKGYLFSQINPVEVNVEKDSVDLEMRIQEGPQATIRKVSISGNDRVYEHVIRRELRVKPGNLYSRDDIITTMREIGQIGHFDLEGFEPKMQPDGEAGVVDIALPLRSKANDQIELSAGWGETGVIGKVSLKFTNFSIKNLFNMKSYKKLIPQGDGETLTLSAQTNARYYQSYSISYLDPWFGGKRPNSLSVGAYYAKQTDISSQYLNNSYSNYYNSYGGYDNGYGGYGNNYGNTDYSFAADPNKSIQMIGASIGYGKRLSWPDDNFFIQAELAYQLYKMKDWAYFLVKDGSCNSVSLNLSLNRRSIDNPIYTRRGSEFSLSVQATPPFSMIDGKDYANMAKTADGYENGKKYSWIEYHKWKFKAKTFLPLAPSGVKRTPVLMTRVEYGLVGYYNKDKKSPFETFYMGGDGMSGYSSTYATETIGLRGYENGSIGNQASAYTRLAMEIRYPVILEPSSTIYLLGFVEAGNAWGNIKDFNPFDLKRSAGFGARIFLPMIGMMGIDWAYGFDSVHGSRQYGGSQFHFIIGQEF